MCANDGQLVRFLLWKLRPSCIVFRGGVSLEQSQRISRFNRRSCKTIEPTKNVSGWIIFVTATDEDRRLMDTICDIMNNKQQNQEKIYSKIHQNTTNMILVMGQYKLVPNSRILPSPSSFSQHPQDTSSNGR